MYYYNIGYYTFEESEHTQLIHEKKFVSNELKEIVEEAYIAIIQDKEMWEKNELLRVTIQNLNQYVIEYLVNNKGFRKIKFQAEWNGFGWANLFEEDWKETVRNKELNSLRDKLKKI
ncbi:MAG: hypothetical protein FWH29_06035 [Methanobrevibacter sp.]|nr:hypothetical protein [Methanobrevibacter sp.]